MSCFDNLVVKLKCPNTQEVKDEYLQLFARKLCIDPETYYLGSIIPLDKNNTLWFSTDYVCNQCSKKKVGKLGPYIPLEGQSRHNVFINMKDNQILEVITKEEFKQRKLPECPDQDNYNFNQ